MDADASGNVENSPRGSEIHGDDFCAVLTTVFGVEGRLWPLETVLGDEAWPPDVAAQRGRATASLTHLTCSECHSFEEMVTHFLTGVYRANLAN